MRTRVFPEPAGAMTLAPPAGWLTAASWSAARSASGMQWPIAESDPASVFQRCTIRIPPASLVGANGPPSTQRGVPSASSMSAVSDSSSPRVAKLLTALRPCHQIGSPLRAS